MKKFLKFLPFVILAVIATSGLVFSHSVPTVSPDAGDIHDIDNATPGLYKVSLGTRLRGILQEGTTTSAACTSGVVACNLVAVTNPATAVVLKTTGANYGESVVLGNGYPGQLRTYVLVTDGGRNFRISPTTKTGFTNAELDDAKDSVTLRYIDDTTGWVISGNNGANIN